MQRPSSTQMRTDAAVLLPSPAAISWQLLDSSSSVVDRSVLSAQPKLRRERGRVRRLGKTTGKPLDRFESRSVAEVGTDDLDGERQPVRGLSGGEYGGEETGVLNPDQCCWLNAALPASDRVSVRGSSMIR